MARLLAILAAFLAFFFINPTSAQSVCESEYVSPDGDRGAYLGQCKSGRPHGKGRVEYFDGSLLLGEFVEGVLEGHDIYMPSEGGRFEGISRNGTANGPGVMEFVDGSTYSGEFKDGQFEGTGVLKYSSGHEYQGQFLKGLSHGQGTFTYADGNRYEGEFEHNQFSGKGTVIYANGNAYEGIFSNGIPVSYSECALSSPCEIVQADITGPEAMGALASCSKIKLHKDWQVCGQKIVNKELWGGNTPLHVFANQGYLQAVKMLAVLGADLDKQDTNGDTALHKAVQAGHELVVQELLRLGADQSLTNKELGQTPLHSSTLNSGDRIFEILVEAGGNINKPDNAGAVPLHLLVFGEEGLNRLWDEITSEDFSLGNVKDMPLMLQGYLRRIGEMATQLKEAHNLEKMIAGEETTRPHLEHSAERLDFALQHEAILDVMSLGGTTPLYNAAMVGNQAAVDILLQRGAKANIITDDGRTPLHAAASFEGGQESALNIARSLVGHGSDIHAATNTGVTPLHSAAWSGQLLLARYLLEIGSNPHARDSEGYTPLNNAVERGHLDLVNLFLAAEARVNEPIENGDTALIIASQNNNSSIVKRLLDSGADTSLSGEKGGTALHGAAGRGLADNVGQLIQAGANVATHTDILGTPLHSVMWGRIGKLKQIQQLEQQMAASEKIKTLNRFVATEADYRRVTDSLLKSGADINAIQIGIRPLHVAAAKGNVYGARRLVKMGADVNAVDDRGWTTLHFLANESGSVIVANMLVNAGVKVDSVTQPGEGQRASTPLGFAAALGHSHLAQFLIENGANVNAKNEREEAPLHRAANFNHAAVITVLLDNAADIEARDSLGGTALHVAAGMGHVESVEVLLARGANVDAPGPMPQLPTPLHLAAYKGNPDIVRRLLAYGANKNATTLQGNTALDLARSRMNSDVVNVLTELGDAH